MPIPTTERLQHLYRATLAQCQAPAVLEACTRLAALLATGLLLSAFSVVPNLLVFGHDEVHYYQDMSDRLAQDGRWLNLLLHDFLRSIPMATWACTFMALAWLLFYRIARAFAFDQAYAALAASTILLTFPFAEQVLWPATALPALAIVVAASLLVARGVPYPFIYLLSGLLIFGTLQTLYFVLPLFFVPQFLSEAESASSRWSLLLRHMCWWVGGSVAGVLVMSTFIWVMTGSFGPQPAEWRLTHPIQNFAGLLGNIHYISQSFVAQLEFLLRQGGVTWSFIFVVALAVLVRARALLAVPQALLLLSAILLSFFAFSIPLAPLIHQRSLIAMAAVVVLFTAWFPGSSPLGRLAGILLLLKLAHGFSVSAEQYLNNRMIETEFFYRKLEALIPVQPTTLTSIALYGTMNPARPEARIFNDPSQIHPVFIALGARKYLDCRLDSRCEPVGSGTVLATAPLADGHLQFAVDENNVGIVRYLAPVGE